MHSLWFVQWDFTRRDHPGNLGRVPGSGPVIIQVVNLNVSPGIIPTEIDSELQVNYPNY